MSLKFVRYNSDFFQRLGLLKMLVATLDPQRRSTAPELISRKLSQLLYRAAGNKLNRAEHLIRSAPGPSWNFTITEPNIKQIIEWGRLGGLVGSGNQITERGLLLRHIMGVDVISSVLNGDNNYNPFDLTIGEKLYLLYIHLEVDSSLYFILKRIADLPPDEPIKGMQANRITCLALYDLFRVMVESRATSKALLTIKGLRELIGRMVTELDLTAEIPITPVVKQRPSSPFRQKPDQRDKKRTKTSDHEAIPRFELLVDLGLLSKKVGEEESNEEKARKSWKYWTTPTLAEFCSRLPEHFDPNFCWNSFAHSAAALVSNKAQSLDVSRDAQSIARRAYQAYLEVKRRFGHTPVESVAIMTMVRALTEAEIIEVKGVHELFLGFKRADLFSDIVHYASGNDIEKMFIDIKPAFLREVEEYYGTGN